ncbi:MAG: hypothetical protein KAU38_03545, partial [Desulfobacterales bacterium]|nr:hypothetical protein [Desulfobacterales bacterium]
AFFEFMERTVGSLEEMDMEDEEKILLLKEFFGWCARAGEEILRQGGGRGPEGTLEPNHQSSP